MASLLGPPNADIIVKNSFQHLNQLVKQKEVNLSTEPQLVGLNNIRDILSLREKEKGANTSPRMGARYGKKLNALPIIVDHKMKESACIELEVHLWGSKTSLTPSPVINQGLSHITPHDSVIHKDHIHE